MNQDRITELAKQAIIDWDDAYDCSEFRVSLEELDRFAELVRAEALEEAVNVALSHYDGYQISEDIRSLK